MENFFGFFLRLANVAALVFLTSFPQRALAFEYEQTLLHQQIAFLRSAPLDRPQVAGVRDMPEFQTTIPEVGQTFTVMVSAYSSTAAQTDSDPFTTASGRQVHIGTMAANFLPLGTVVRLDGRAYVVEDRMHSRFDGQRMVDIWMNSSEMAQQFGVRALALEIVRLP